MGYISKEDEIIITKTMLVAALVTITKTWKQLKYPLTHEWITENVINIQLCTYRYIHMYIYTYIHIDTHIHIYTYTSSPVHESVCQ